jgi:hypothetical protein
MKKFFLGIVIGFILSIAVGVGAIEYIVYSNPYQIYIDGVKQEVEALNVNGYTFLKLADVGKSFGKTVNFNETESKIEISSNTIQSVTPQAGIQIEHQPVTEGSGQMEVKNIYIKSNSISLSDVDGQNYYLINNNEKYLPITVLSKYLKSNGDKYILVINEKEISFTKSSIGSNDNTLKYINKTFIKLSALGLTAREDGDTLWIE